MFDPKSTVCRSARDTIKVIGVTRLGSAVAVAVLAALALTGISQAQTTPDSQNEQAPASREQQAPAAQPQPPDTQQPTPNPPPTPSVPDAMPGMVVQNPNAPCVQPPPPVTWRDYQGPFAKTVAVFGERLERKSVAPGHAPQAHYKPGALLCTLELKDKFWLFVHDSTDPVAFLNAGYNAVVDQVQDNQASFGTGPRGFGDRFGANLAGQASAGFFKDLVYPTIFKEDPRFYRLGTGSTNRRIIHAMSHVVIGHTENGGRMFNFTEWLGDISVTVLSNTYLPDNRRGVAPVAESVAETMGSNAGYDVLREFWPEIAKKFHLPFREQNESTNAPTFPN
jgi:hypothetical protein